MVERSQEVVRQPGWRDVLKVPLSSSFTICIKTEMLDKDLNLSVGCQVIHLPVSPNPQVFMCHYTQPYPGLLADVFEQLASSPLVKRRRVE